MRVPLSAQCTLSCSQGLQVSLDQNGEALITPLMVAPNAGNSCPGPLTVSLFNSLGQPLPNPLSCDQIGQTVTARVRHTSSGNLCEGTLTLQDALPPSLNGCEDLFIFCHEDSAPEAAGHPVGIDNCTPATELIFNYFDTQTALSCGTFHNGQPVLKRIDRNWTVTDQRGNSSQCQQQIWLKHITQADVVFPPNLDHISAPALACGQDPDNLDLTGQPSVNGIPIGASPACEFGVTFSDQSIQHCAPAGFTILRNWTLIDFCSGSIVNRTQIIRVEDNEAPTLVAPDDITVGTDGFHCTGSVVLPQADFWDNCSAVTVVPTWFYGTGYGPFTGVTLGQHVVTYTATDACGNQSTATMTLSVEDTSPPQAICAAELQVSVSSNGAALVHASTVNAGSFDNCGPVTMSISRDELEYLPWIELTCADQGAPILLTLRVTDAVGLENFCQMEVTVRDFLKPTVQCPPDISLNCLQDYSDLGLTGQASATDNCSLQSIEFQDFENIQPCNIGSVSRWWVATDSAGNTRTCSQQITVNVLDNATVSFPTNTSVNGCAGPGSLSPVATGEPVIGGQFCSPLSVNYTDQIFSIAPPSCFRIFRNWKVIDHCIYNPNGGTAGVWEHIQIIDVVDNTPPLLSVPDDLTVAADPFTCLGTVQLPDATATDCSSSITFSHDGGYPSAGPNNASGQYPLGVHVVTFSATDACGNLAQQTMRITVQDQTPPNAVCLPGVSANLGPNSAVTLNPNWFDGGCSDFCSPQNSLVLSVYPDVFDCQQIGIHAVTLSVRDTAGNESSCNTQVQIKDPAQHCGGGGLGYEIGGNIRTEQGHAIHNIPITLITEGMTEQVNCDTTGVFMFSDVPAGADYIIKPHNNANWLNGVTTYDLVLISKHILGIEPFDSPYKMIAADANRSGSITTFDIVLLRQLILGITDSLASNTSWRFVDSAHVFPNVYNPFAHPFPEQIVVDALAGHQLGKNFVGLKVGDVNGNTNPADARNPVEVLGLQLSNVAFQAGQTFDVPLSLAHWTGLEGLQFELQIDPSKVRLERVSFARPEWLGGTHVALFDGGLLRVSWDHAMLSNAEPMEEREQLLTLHLRGVSSGDLQAAVQLTDTRLMPEAYRPGSALPAAIELRFEHEQSSAPATALAISPNPTRGSFWVNNPFQGEFSSLRIMDARGTLIGERYGFLPDTIEWNGSAHLEQGLYFVEWRQGGRVCAGKVVVN